MKQILKRKINPDSFDRETVLMGNCKTPLKKFFYNKLVFFSFQKFLQLLKRCIYGEDPASQNNYFEIIIHKMHYPTKNNPKPLIILRDIYKLNHTSFDKIIEFHTRILFPKFPSFQ